MSEPHGEKQEPEKDKDKEPPKPSVRDVVAVASQKGKDELRARRTTGRPTSAAGRLFGAGGLGVTKTFTEDREKRIALGIKDNKDRESAKKSLDDEFFAKFAASNVEFGRAALDHFTTRFDQPTFDFFEEDATGATTLRWLQAQSSSSFHILLENADTLQFTVYFVAGTDGKRRSVFGYMKRGTVTGKRYKIVHIGPAK